MIFIILFVLLFILIFLINSFYFLIIDRKKISDSKEIFIFHMVYWIFLNTFSVKYLLKIFTLPQTYGDTLKIKKILYLFIDTTNYMYLYIGITAVLGSLLIYAANITYSEKKHIFFESTKISYQFVLMVFTYTLFFLNVNVIFLLGALAIFIKNLIKSVQNLVIIEADRSKYPKLFIDTIKSITNKSMVNTYSNRYDNLKKSQVMNSDVNQNLYTEIKAEKKGYIVNIRLDQLNVIAENNSEISQNDLKPIILVRWLNEYVEKGATLAWVHKSHTKKVNKIFVLSKNEPQNDTLKNTMEYLGESLSDSLNTNNIVRLTNLVSIFYQLVDEFNIKIFEVKSSWGSNNKLIEIIANSYEMAIISSNTNLFRAVYYLPVKVANKAYEIDELNTFEYSIYFMPKIYDFYFKTKDVYFELRTVEGLKHIMYMISSDYEKSKNKYYLNTYLLSTLKIIQTLVIKSITNKDLRFYKEFLALLIEWFEHKPNKDKNTDLIIKSSYLGVFLYLLSIKAEDDVEVFNEYFDELKEYLDFSFEELMEVFKYIKGNSIISKFEWDEWFIPKAELVKVKFYRDDTSTYLNIVFNLLSIISRGSYDRAKDYVIFETYKIDEYLKIVEDKIIPFQEKWNLIFPNKISIERIEEYKAFLEECKKLKIEKEKEETTLSHLSLEKIEKIKTKFKSKLKESKFLKFLNNSGKYNYYSDQNGENVNSFGINRIENKNYFINNASFYSESLGEIYGRTHIKILQYKFIEALDKNSVKRKIKSLNSVLNKFEGIGDIIMFASNISDYDIEEQTNTSEQNKEPKFIPRWKLKSEEKTLQEFFKEDLFIGMYRYKDVEIPVYRVYGGTEALYLLSYDKIDSLNHYNPKKDDETECVEFCSFYVKDFSHNIEIRDSLIKSNPPWLSEYGDIDSKIKYLDTLVLFKSFQNIKVEFNTENQSKIYKFDFSESNKE